MTPSGGELLVDHRIRVFAGQPPLHVVEVVQQLGARRLRFFQFAAHGGDPCAWSASTCRASAAPICCSDSIE